MRLNKLTARQVETAKRDGVYGDGGGLYLRVRNDARHWLFIYVREGRRREMGLGAPPAVTLAKARERASAARDLLADGKDPLDHRRAEAGVPTFGEVADDWMAERESSVRNGKSIDRWRRCLGPDGHADALRPLRVDRITTEHVLNVLKPIWSKSATAPLVRGYIEGVLDAAKVRQLRTGENPARWKGHLDHILPRPKKLGRGHHAAMPYAEVPAFMARLRTHDGVAARLVEFTILTAARSGEALGADWSEFDLDEGVWTIPASRMKAGREHRVPLCPRALAVVTGLRKTDKPQGPVFASGGRPLSNMAGSMLLRRMKVKETMHGFRSAFRDFAGDITQHPREIAEAALAHTLGGVESAYRRSDALNRRRQLMCEWSAYCAGMGGGR